MVRQRFQQLSRHWKIGFGLVAFGVALAIFMFFFMLAKDRELYRSERYRRSSSTPARTVVIYYSRSGNTRALARAIARAKDADIVQLATPSYSLDFWGWWRAGSDARNHVEREVLPEHLDLSQYDRVYLGSPIWMTRPSPPLWAFVRRTDFTGKEVVLFNTFNSQFKEIHIQEFRKLIEARGGKLVDHIHICRGRIFGQMTGEEFEAAVAELVEKR
jgi:flavodoxin